MDLQRTDRIELRLATDADELQQAIEENLEYLAGETLATSIAVMKMDELSDSEPVEVEIRDFKMKIFLRVAS